MMPTTHGDYYYICGDPTVPSSCESLKTIIVNDRISADLDASGRVIGVDSTSGLVDFEDLVEFLKIVRIEA